MTVKIIKALATESFCYKTNKPLSPVGIVLHSTGCNNPKLSRYCDNAAELGENYYNNFWGTGTYAEQANRGIPHAAIGYDKKKNIAIAQVLPFNIRCWGCGSGANGSYNVSHIQIEICEDSLTDEDYFNKCFEKAADFCVELIKAYPAIKIKNIVSHKEAAAAGYASFHGDPENWLEKYGKNMEWFREKVESKLEPENIYRVQVGAFKSLSNAEKMRDELINKNYQAFIVRG